MVINFFFNFRSTFKEDAALMDVTWYVCTEPYYGADEIQHFLSTSGKLFSPYITSAKDIRSQ